MKSKPKARLLDLTTVVVSLVALAIGADIFLARISADTRQKERREDRRVGNWEAVVSRGQRIGSEVASVTIVEFMDYECPYCRKLEEDLRALRAAFPGEVAVVVRHFPIPYHPNAYRAARFSECAANQGRFETVHEILLRTRNLADLDGLSVAEEAGILDVDRFVECVSLRGEVAAIETDIAAAKELQLRGTQALIVNGTYLRSTPDSSALWDLFHETVGDRSNGGNPLGIE